MADGQFPSLVSKDRAANAVANPIFVELTDGSNPSGTPANPIAVNVVSGVLSDEFIDYQTDTAASDGSVTFDYTVTGTTGILTSLILASSGDTKFTVSYGPLLTLVPAATVFLTGKEGDTKQINFGPAVESTGVDATIRVVALNREGQSNDIYCTMIGRDIA